MLQFPGYTVSGICFHYIFCLKAQNNARDKCLEDSGGSNYTWRVQLAFPGWLACGFGHKPIGIGLSLPQIAWETSGWQGSKHLESHAPRFDLYTFGYLWGLGWLKTAF